MDIKFSGSDAGGFQFDPNAAPKPKRERKPRKSIGSKGGRIAVNTLVTLLIGAVFFYVQMPAINLHAEEFYGFVLLLCVTYCICALFTSGFQGTGAKGYFTFVKAVHRALLCRSGAHRHGARRRADIVGRAAGQGLSSAAADRQRQLCKRN